jgi:hypothetical protein
VGNLRISVNELLKDETNGTLFRVLWIDQDSIIAFVIDVNEQNAFPVARKVHQVLDDIVTGDLIKVKEDPLLPVVDNGILESHLQKRDQAWDLIREIVLDEPDIYEKDRRGELIQQVIKSHNVSSQRSTNTFADTGSEEKLRMPSCLIITNQAAKAKKRVLGIQSGEGPPYMVLTG